ncbi:hypothetical protein BMS3Bbin02_00810 [bacterium BMS3Bbin02]|nr:hypothetical protein BMS3Bbin02_00810 [bacterium BMS3Bbin02]
MASKAAIETGRVLTPLVVDGAVHLDTGHGVTAHRVVLARSPDASSPTVGDGPLLCVVAGRAVYWIGSRTTAAPKASSSAAPLITIDVEKRVITTARAPRGRTMRCLAMVSFVDTTVFLPFDIGRS